MPVRMKGESNNNKCIKSLVTVDLKLVFLLLLPLIVFSARSVIGLHLDFTEELQDDLSFYEPVGQRSEPSRQPAKKEKRTNNTKPLVFLHIPKTAGSTIEKWGSMNGYSWGYCLFRTLNHADHCPFNPKFEELNLNGLPHDPFWHRPIQRLPAKLQGLYSNSTIFTIVRNPFEKIVSEYYYKRTLKPRSKENEKDKFNRWIIQSLKQFSGCIQRGGSSEPKHLSLKPDDIKNKSCYFHNGGHLIPQYDYIFDENGKKMVDHILRFENFTAEFLELVRDINFTADTDIRLRERKDSSKLTVEDLSPRAKGFIRNVYKRDFELGDYDLNF